MEGDSALLLGDYEMCQSGRPWELCICQRPGHLLGFSWERVSELKASLHSGILGRDSCKTFCLWFTLVYGKKYGSQSKLVHTVSSRNRGH